MTASPTGPPRNGRPTTTVPDVAVRSLGYGRRRAGVGRVAGRPAALHGRRAPGRARLPQPRCRHVDHLRRLGRATSNALARGLVALGVQPGDACVGVPAEQRGACAGSSPTPRSTRPARWRCPRTSGCRSPSWPRSSATPRSRRCSPTRRCSRRCRRCGPRSRRCAIVVQRRRRTGRTSRPGTRSAPATPSDFQVPATVATSPTSCTRRARPGCRRASPCATATWR